MQSHQSVVNASHNMRPHNQMQSTESNPNQQVPINWIIITHTNIYIYTRIKLPPSDTLETEQYMTKMLILMRHIIYSQLNQTNYHHNRGDETERTLIFAEQSIEMSEDALHSNGAQKARERDKVECFLFACSFNGESIYIYHSIGQTT